MREVNYDRLRELAGYLRDAVRQLRELGRAPRDAFLADARTVNLGDFDEYLHSVGRYLGGDVG